MKLIIPFNEITKKDRLQVGGKACSLAVMSRKDLNIPNGVCITTEAYHTYVESTGLRNRIDMELNRKAFVEMRWEEIWDAALRIRNLFLNSPIPHDLKNTLAKPIKSFFADQPVSVRSSAPGEDSSETSFAGLHESFVNLNNSEQILEHVRLVWASLWSDRAILYRQELDLDVEQSAMAVIIQKMIFGEKSGVVFGINPMDKNQAVIESVYGLNQGLVDGSIEPDRWIIDRTTAQIISHHSAQREKLLSQGEKGVRAEILAPNLRHRPPLEPGEVSEVFSLALKAEELFKAPQDMEWTYARRKLHTLQARPITTRSDSGTDDRPWYLNLHRSFENLKHLRSKIENEIIPAMEADAANLGRVYLSGLSDPELVAEIERREKIFNKWQEVYKEDCIPFAHGMRLFAKIYNDMIKPEDPFEFMALLCGRDMASISRNSLLLDLADRIRKTPQLANCLEEDRLSDCDGEFQQQFEQLLEQFGDLAWGQTQFGHDAQQLFDLLIELASHPENRQTVDIKDAEVLENKFLGHFDTPDKAYALELLDLARASYQLRDDDNIYIGKIEGQVLRALNEGHKRISDRDDKEAFDDHLEKVLKRSNVKPVKPLSEVNVILKKEKNLKVRQIVGQPAGPGVSVGKARVIQSPTDLFQFKQGEILVCDAIDPGMTFVVPLASGIVERRGGMLIHGAIIAREYGIPCVTGAPGVDTWIETGDMVTVDGFLGIVIVGRQDSEPATLSVNESQD